MTITKCFRRCFTKNKFFIIQITINHHKHNHIRNVAKFFCIGIRCYKLNVTRIVETLLQIIFR